MRSSINQSWKREREDNSLINRIWRPSKVHYVSWSMWGGETGMWKTSLMMSLARKCRTRFSKQCQVSGPRRCAAFPFCVCAPSCTLSLPNVAGFEMNSGRCSVKSLINLLVLPDWDEGGRNLLRASLGSERGCGCGGATTAVTAWGTSGWAPTSKEMLLPRGSKQKVADLLPPCLGITKDFQWKYFPC